MPPRASLQLSLAAFRALQRISEEAPGAVSAAAVLELGTAAIKLMEYTQRTCSIGRTNHTVMVPAGECGWSGRMLTSPGVDQEYSPTSAAAEVALGTQLGTAKRCQASQ
jgi:hypothetical protein